MATSRASTSAGRRRSAERERSAQGTPRTHTTTHAGTATPKKPGKKTAPKQAPKRTANKPPSRKAPAATRAKPRPRTKPAGAKPRIAKPSALNAALVAGALLVVLVGAYFFWFRDSSFVAVEKVTVDGMAGPEAAAVTKALTQTSEEMTTLHVDEGGLAASVSRYPTVVSIQAEANFPHGMTVHVVSRPPVMLATATDQSVPVAGDGTILRGVDTSHSEIPSVAVADLPSGAAVTGDSLAVAEVAGAAPAPLLPLIEKLTASGDHGIEVTLKGGIPVIFGDSDQAEEKWAAAAAVLANPKVKTLTHLDVRVPERPSIGGAAPPLAAG